MKIRSKGYRPGGFILPILITGILLSAGLMSPHENVGIHNPATRVLIVGPEELYGDIDRNDYRQKLSMGGLE